MKEFLLILLVFFLFYPLISYRPTKTTYEVREVLLMKLSFLFFVTALSVVVGEVHG